MGEIRKPTWEERERLITTIANNPKLTFKELKSLFPDLGVRRLAGYWRKYGGKGVSMENQKEVKMPDINTEKLLEDVKRTSQEAAKAYLEEIKQTEEQKAKEKRLEDTIADTVKLKEQVSAMAKQLEEITSSTKTFCEQFPNLCKVTDELKVKVSDLEKKTVKPETKTESPKPKVGIAGTSHTTLEELVECPKCKPEAKVKLFLDLMKKVGPERAAVQICGDDEICKATLTELVKKGYTIGEPKKEEPKAEVKPRSAFNIGQPSKLS